MSCSCERERERQVERSHRELAERFLFHLVLADHISWGPEELVTIAVKKVMLFEETIAALDERKKTMDKVRRELAR